LPNIQSFNAPSERFFKLDKRGIQYRRFGNQHIFASFESRCHIQKKGSEPSFGPGTLDGVADLFAGDESDSAFSAPGQRKKHECRVVPAFAGFVDPVEISAAFQGFEVDQTANRLRPLARRALMILRPFFVFMRVRKPCVLLRGVLWG